jgi:hypothetical protein
MFVRVYESRMELMRAVIIGAERTPYHDGLFFFDLYLPYDFPNVPPVCASFIIIAIYIVVTLFILNVTNVIFFMAESAAPQSMYFF